MSCPPERHAILRRNVVAFELATETAYAQDDGAGGAVLCGRCSRCGSDIALDRDVARYATDEQIERFSTAQCPVYRRADGSPACALSPSKLRPQDIMGAVASYYEIDWLDLIGPRRPKTLADARMVAMFLIRQLTTASYPEIGRLFGGRHHTTAIHAVAAVEKRMRECAQTRDDVARIRAIVRTISEERIDHPRPTDESSSRARPGGSANVDAH